MTLPFMEAARFELVPLDSYAPGPRSKIKPHTMPYAMYLGQSSRTCYCLWSPWRRQVPSDCCSHGQAGPRCSCLLKYQSFSTSSAPRGTHLAQAPQRPLRPWHVPPWRKLALRGRLRSYLVLRCQTSPGPGPPTCYTRKNMSSQSCTNANQDPQYRPQVLRAGAHGEGGGRLDV